MLILVIAMLMGLRVVVLVVFLQDHARCPTHLCYCVALCPLGRYFHCRKGFGAIVSADLVTVLDTVSLF